MDPRQTFDMMCGVEISLSMETFQIYTALLGLRMHGWQTISSFQMDLLIEK